MAIAEAKSEPDPDALSLAEAQPRPHALADPFAYARRSRSGGIHLFHIFFS